MTLRWTQQQERGNRFMLALLAWLALHLGRPFVRLLLYPIVLYYMLTAAPARRASRHYLQKVLPRAPGWRDVFRHFYTFALVSVDRLFFLAGRFDQFAIDMQGGELFDQYLAAQQGCLLLVSHLGSFEAMRTIGTRQRALPIRILMDRQHNARAMALIDALDPALAQRILDAGTPAPALALTLNEYLRQGDLVGLMADRAGAGERTLNCRFLNGRAAFPLGPWLLGLTLKVPVILCVGLYLGGNRYRIHFELISERLVASRGERQQVLASLVGHYAGRLEHYARSAPYNWFNFYQFWSDESATDH